jgi:hypothetical protein
LQLQWQILVPLLSEQLAKRQSCSSSDSTWRHSSSTEEEDELECLEEKDEDGGQRMKGGEMASADEISVTEEAAQAYAMAVVLAGNGLFLFLLLASDTYLFGTFHRNIAYTGISAYTV